MILPEELPVDVELGSKEPLKSISAESDGIVFQSRKREGDKELLALTFRGRGQKTVSRIPAVRLCDAEHLQGFGRGVGSRLQRRVRLLGGAVPGREECVLPVEAGSGDTSE